MNNNNDLKFTKYEQGFEYSVFIPKTLALNIVEKTKKVKNIYYKLMPRFKNIISGLKTPPRL